MQRVKSDVSVFDSTTELEYMAVPKPLVEIFRKKSDKSKTCLSFDVPMNISEKNSITLEIPRDKLFFAILNDDEDE